MSAGPMPLPECPVHGKTMGLRDPATPEQAFCGTWYDCARAGCTASVLLPSPELAALYAARGRPAGLGEGAAG